MTQESDSGLVPCPTCDGGARGFGQTNAGIFKRCPQCDGRTEVPAESDSSPVSVADLAYAFYNGVPWEKLTDDERAAFLAYQERTDR